MVLPWLAAAQPAVTSRGSVSTMLDALPAVHATELRVRVENTLDADIGERWAVKAGSWVDGLVGRRRGATEGALVYQPGEIYARYRRAHLDVTAGFQRIVWGTLDEIQPTDLINPLDVSRFVMDGRSEARLPVLALRGRLFLPHDTTVDAVYLPFFRRARPDLLNETTSPFNLRADTCQAELCSVLLTDGAARQELRLPIDTRPPARTVGNGSVGLRVSRPLRGVDLSASIYRGWQAFPLVSLAPVAAAVPDTTAGPPAQLTTLQLLESWSRLTMIGGDLETARGAVTWRAEGALLVDTAVQAAPGTPVVDGRSLQVGAGADWGRGAWRVFGNALVRRAWARGPAPQAVPPSGGLQLVGGAERTFARETRRVRAFAAVDPVQHTTFVRLLGSWNLRDNVWLEGAAGWFTGDGSDLLGQFTDRDFVSARLKVYF